MAANYQLPVKYAKRRSIPPIPEPRSRLISLRNQATSQNVPWSLQDSAADIRFAINFYNEKKNSIGNFEEVNRNVPYEYEYPPPELVVDDVVETNIEEIRRKAVEKAKNPLARVQSSSLNMGIPPESKTTLQRTMEQTQISSRNVVLMTKLKMIDESAQRLQAMLREETASVPGQQIPDKARTFMRNEKKKEYQNNIIDIATKDYGARPKSCDITEDDLRSVMTG